jgi:hypothetical protein
MMCFSLAGMHAVVWIPMRTARSRRPFETTRVSFDHARREPAALAGFVSRRVKPHALRHTEQAIWIDQARRHGRALRDTRTHRRWVTAPSNESIPAEGEAFRKAYVPRRCVLPLFTISPAKAPCADKTLFALRGKLKNHGESPKVKNKDYAERWIKKVSTLH